MKHAYIVVAIAFLLLFGESTPILAKTDMVSATKGQGTVVEETDVPSLIVDPLKEPPRPNTVPKPVPSPMIKAFEPVDPFSLIKDDRAWIKSEYRTTIHTVAAKYNLDPQLIYATIMTESEGNKYAFRYEPHIKDASLCVGQILISTARRLGFTGNPKELYEPETCIDLVGKYHRDMLDTFGNLTPLQLAAAYNSGSPWKRPVRGHLQRFWSWYEEKAT